MHLKRYLAPALVAAALLGACADNPAGLPPTETAPSPRVLGVVEITFSGIGTPHMSARVSPLRAPGAPSGARFAVSPGVVGEGGRTGLQVGARTTSTLDAGGQRYLQAVFQIRNASSDGTAYSTARTNVSFLPVSTASTISGTPVRSFLKQDGTAADPSLAVQLQPTGAVISDGSGSVASQYPDVLQLFTESEVAGIDMGSAPAVTNRFPYGFVVRRVGNNSTRSLPANPAVGQFDGAVTLAYRFPLQATSADNPFTISVVALVVEESETHVSQSLEEQATAGRAAFEARAAALGATQVSILPGGAYTGAATQRTVCDVRTAGTAGSATTVLGACPPPPATSPFAITCTVDVGTAYLDCGSSPYVQFTTSNVVVGNGLAQFDVTVQNLLNEDLGTPDGVRIDSAGVPVVFTSGPTVVSGSGAVSVANSDASFYGSPAFRYNEKLSKNQVSGSKTWQISYDPGVTKFTFQVEVQATRQPLLVINELMANPANFNSNPDATGEWVEIYNAGTLPVNMQNLVIADSVQAGRRPYHLISSSLVVQPGGYVVLGRSANTTSNGGVPVDYSYGTAIAFANSVAAFKISRVYGTDTLTIDRTQYANAAISAQDGVSRELKNPALDNSNMDGSNWAGAAATAVYGAGGRGTPKAQNSTFVP